jgi:acyl-CoA synthetase (AMP-forming)/AMP-acid ligase II
VPPTTGPIDNLARLFVEACRGRGAADFLVDEAERFSGRDAERASLAAVSALRGLGIKAGDRIGFLARSSARHAVLWFAAQLLSAVPINLHILEADARLTEVAGWLELDLLIADAEFVVRAHSIAADRKAPVLDLNGIDLRHAPASVPALDDARPDAVAAIMLSSGSTGAPKGVIHTQRSLIASALAASDVYGRVSQPDATAVFMGTSFAAWMNVVLPFVAAHAKIAFRSRFSPEEFVAVLENEAITVAPAVPTMWRMALAAKPDRARLSLRTAMMSGEPGTSRDIAAIRAGLCDHVVAAYLSTEGACGSAIVADERDLAIAERADCAGYPIPGGEVRIVDPNGGIEDQLPDGVVGEVAVRSASVAVGYWKDPQLSARRFVNGWWRSGDLGVREANGVIRIRGRTDNLINSGGIKVHAEEVELALLRVPAVAQAAVIGIADDRWGQRLEAFVVLAGGSPASEESILDACRAEGRLAAVKLPKRIHFVESLPRSPTGKVYRPGLRAVVEKQNA